ncbi:hypothetical protein IWW36_000177 [Coemansia brasiliensis]|uniref:Uncharacterized protein n=1 Tax=Coemansia brasiliensis TaxID=2650707 RepID=A0A9W8IJ48_9FUNG|nr:hypothetical protein IWW36_000177 [Coemansia brasiliensis]
MFASKKSKGRRNIRKKEADAAEEAHGSGSAAVIKRSAKSNSVSTKNSRLATHNKDAAADKLEHVEEQRQYTDDDLLALKEESSVSVAKSESNYPFSSGDIPNAQEIYMAKKLRRQRQAAQKMVDDVDYIRLSEDLNDTQIYTSEADTMGYVAIDGEDELDRVIIDKNERSEFEHISKQAMKETIEQMDDMSDWENEQLRNAGVSASFNQSNNHKQLPKDNGFKFDMDQFKFIIAQEENQMAIDQSRLNTAKEKLEASLQKLDELQQSISHAQKQYDHFLSLVKSTT